MARLACVILPEYPHHIIQRGNQWQDVFSVRRIMFFYPSLLKEWGDSENIEICAYCLNDKSCALFTFIQRRQ
jgi:putative transposase